MMSGFALCANVAEVRKQSIGQLTMVFRIETGKSGLPLQPIVVVPGC